MTVAEKMADDFIVAAEGGPIAAELETLITTVAERGIEEGCKKLDRMIETDEPGSESQEAWRFCQHMLRTNRWWEEQV